MRPFDKGCGAAVPHRWDSVACVSVSVLLLFAVGSLHAERVASRKGPVLRTAWSSDGMILAAASSNQTVKPQDGDAGKPRASLEGITLGGCLQHCMESEWKDPGLECW